MWNMELSKKRIDFKGSIGWGAADCQRVSSSRITPSDDMIRCRSMGAVVVGSSQYLFVCLCRRDIAMLLDNKDLDVADEI